MKLDTKRDRLCASLIGSKCDPLAVSPLVRRGDKEAKKYVMAVLENQRQAMRSQKELCFRSYS
jgi:hypothetical protein